VLKDTRKVIIKHIEIEDYEKNNNFEFYYTWRAQVDTFMTRKIRMENLEQDRKKYSEFLENPEEHVILGAFHNNRLIGLTALHIELTKERIAHIGHWGIMIHPDFHNNGLGTELLTQLEKEARNRGILKLEASYVSKNKAAEKLYLEKMNYIIEGRKILGIKLDDGTYDEIVLIGKILYNIEV